MYRAGYREIVVDLRRKQWPKCMNCGRRAEKVVTFRDTWCTLNIRLCNACALMPYEKLNLEQTLKFPVGA